MLIVTDQPPFVIRRERRLTRAGKAKEERCIALCPHISRAMHGKDIFQRQQIIERRKDRLLNLTGVAGASYDHRRVSPDSAR